MASIQKRPDGRWRARYRDAAGKEHAKHFTRKIDAQRWVDEVTASVVTGTYVDPNAGKITFSQWFGQWSERQVWAPGTVLAARQAADSTTFRDVPIKAIRPSHVQEWIKSMSKPGASRQAGLAPTTIKTRFNYVHMAFRAAVLDRVIPLDPSAGAVLPRARRAEAAMTIPTVEEVAGALGAAQEWFRPFIGVCGFAGLRLGEAAGLQLGDVDFLRRTISVRRQVQGANRKTTEVVPPKYGSERVVYVPGALVEMIARHVQDVGVRGEEQWLFSSGAALLNRNTAGHQWRQTRLAAGLGEYTLHDLRHFFASALIADGCDVVTVQRALGHSSPTITLGVYAHLWPSAEDKTRTAAAGLMAAVLGSPADSVRTGG